MINILFMGLENFLYNKGVIYMIKVNKSLAIVLDSIIVVVSIATLFFDIFRK